MTDPDQDSGDIPEGPRVLLVDGELRESSNGGGAGESLRAMAAELAHDFTPIICSWAQNPFHSGLVSEGFRCTTRVQDGRMRRLLLGLGQIRGGGRVRKLLLSRRLAPVMRDLAPRIVHINMLRKWDRFDAQVARARGAKVVAHVRSLAHQVTFTAMDLQACDAVICVSDHVREFVQDMAPQTRTLRIWDSVNPSLYRNRLSRHAAREALSIPDDRTAAYLVSLAALESRKGHDTAIQSLAALRERGIPARLAIVGSAYRDGDQREHDRLLGLAKAAGLDSHVHFTGQVAPQDLHIAYAAADIVVALSSDGEAFGRVPVEAALARRPIIATALGATPEVIIDGRTGFLVPPRDPEAVAASVQQICGAPAATEALIDAAETRANEEFSLEAHRASLAPLYRDLIGMPMLDH